MSERLAEIEARLNRFDAAIPQREVSACWGQPHFFSDCKDCDAHSEAREKFNIANRELHETGQSDLHWLIDELKKERQKVTLLVEGMIGVSYWASKSKPTGYCWHDRRSCLKDNGSGIETCLKANKALQFARKP